MAMKGLCESQDMTQRGGTKRQEKPEHHVPKNSGPLFRFCELDVEL